MTIELFMPNDSDKFKGGTIHNEKIFFSNCNDCHNEYRFDCLRR